MKQRLLNLMIIYLLLAACGGKSAFGETTPTPQGTPPYTCFIDAWNDKGKAALPQPLPSTSGPDGELVYDIAKPDGTVIPMKVFSVGPYSLAPGRHLAQNLKDDGWFGKLPISSRFEYKNLTGIELWVINKGDNVLPTSVADLVERWPKRSQYLFPDSDQPLGLTLMVPFFAGATQEELQANYDAFVQRQAKHTDEIWSSIIKDITAARDTDRSKLGLSQACLDHIYNYWDSQLQDAMTRQAAGATPPAGEGRFIHHPDPTTAGNWSAIIVIHFNPKWMYVGQDGNYVYSGSRLSYYDKDDKPVYYDVSGEGLFVIDHELNHAHCGSDESCADAGATSWLTEQGIRIDWSATAFEADMVPIELATGKVVTTNLPPLP